MDRRQYVVPDGQRQATIHQLLLTARKVWLSDALQDAVSEVDPLQLKREVIEYVPHAAQRRLAILGIRDEAVFPLPAVLSAKPTLVGYYRLLLGVSQKRFYSAATGLSRLKRLEDGAPLTSALTARLPDYCRAMAEALSGLVMLADATLEARDIEDLQLLTLGSFYYGSLNNTIGQTAILGVLTAIVSILEPHISDRGSDWFTVVTPNDRSFHIQVASDPDLYSMCWTIINMAGVDIDKLYQGSPTTNEWFDTNEVVGQTGNDWDRFRQQIRLVVGLE